MIPMHLDLIDWLFVPHNLISAQESPVPLPKFQIAPRLQILMSSGSKNRTQIYYPFLSKSPGKRIHLQVPQQGCPLTDHFYISLDISLYLKALRKERTLWKQTPIPEPYLTYLSEYQVKEPSLQVPLMESPRREMPHS
jgi:hypothetical protein